MQKFFDGVRFAGTVVSRDVCNKTKKTMWHVLYDDGDEEDLFDEEIKKLLSKTSECNSLNNTRTRTHTNTQNTHRC